MSMTQAVSYNFSTVENPLSDGGNFTAIADSTFTGALKTIAGNLCEPTATAKSSASFWSAAIAAPSGTWPVDQYSEITLTTWATVGDYAFLILRQGSAASGTQYIVSIIENGASGLWSLQAIVAGTTHNLVTNQAQANAQGDVFRATIVGNVITLYRNGSQVQTFTDTNNYIASGAPGFGFYDVTAISSGQTSLWAAGANQSATPTFSPVAGSYSGTQTVTITSSTGGTIYYTTDGTTPTEASSSISSGGTISVSATETVKVIASIANKLDSAVGSAAYTITPTLGAFVAQPLPVTITNNIGNKLSITSPTVGAFLANPTPVVFCDPNGNEYAVTGATQGGFIQAPLPVVLCNSNGLPIVPPIVITSNGNTITVSATLSGNKMGAPTPVVLTNNNGLLLGQSGFSYGSALGNPTPVVLCNLAGQPITATLAT